MISDAPTSTRASITIIIPAKNVGLYIYACLSSCVSSAKRATELMIVEDGSDDNTLQEIKRFVCDFPGENVRLFKHEAIGPGPARNLCIEAATSDYVAFVDGDDLICRETLEHVCAQMDAHHADVAMPLTTSFDDGGAFTHQFDWRLESFLHGRPLVVTESRSSPELLCCETSMCMRVFSRRFLMDAGIRFGYEKFCEDVFPSRKAILMANRILAVNKTYYYYRLNRDGQRTTTRCSSTRQIVSVVRESVNLAIDVVRDDQQGACFLFKMMHLGYWSLELSHLEELPGIATSLVEAFDKVPRGWRRALRDLPDCDKRTRRFVNLSLIGAGAEQRISAFTNAPATFMERARIKLRGKQ